MRVRKLAGIALVLLLSLSTQSGRWHWSRAADGLSLKGLRAAVRVVWDSDFIPHVFAETDRDAMLALGYVHARDRFFQMDLLRRQASGTPRGWPGGSPTPITRRR